MDRFERHAEYIMKRGEKILAAKERRNKVIRRVTYSCSGVAAAVIICLFTWKSVPASTELPSDLITQESNTTVTTSNLHASEKTETVFTTVSTTSKKAATNTVTASADVRTSVSAADINNCSETEQTRSVSTALQADVTTARNNDIEYTETVTTTAEPVQEYISDVFWGYNEDIDYGNSDSSPMPKQNLAMKCKSFCAAGEKLKVDVAMADTGVESFSYDKEGDYKFEVAVCDPNDYRNIDDKKFIVNGERRRYRKEYSDREAKSFEIKGNYDDYDSYHHETAEIDFTEYEVGSSGCIKFAFEIEFTDDPHHKAYTTANQYMYFYVGENGTFISNKLIENEADDIQQAAPNKEDANFSRGHNKHHGSDS